MASSRCFIARSFWSFGAEEAASAVFAYPSVLSRSAVRLAGAVVVGCEELEAVVSELLSLSDPPEPEPFEANTGVAVPRESVNAMDTEMRRCVVRISCPLQLS
jgi:hypothetical protein